MYITYHLVSIPNPWTVAGPYGQLASVYIAGHFLRFMSCSVSRYFPDMKFLPTIVCSSCNMKVFCFPLIHHQIPLLQLLWNFFLDHQNMLFRLERELNKGEKNGRSRGSLLGVLLCL